MRYLVTAVPISRTTRRRIGKAMTEIIDTTVNKYYKGCNSPTSIERVYEGLNAAKVVDVREVKK